MKKFLLLGLAAITASSFGSVLTSTHSYTIETTGTYRDDSYYAYFNFGLVSGFNSFGVLDFDGTSLAGKQVKSASLSLTDSVTSSAKTTVVKVFAVTDNATSLKMNQTKIEYSTAAGAVNGYSNQLGVATLLGSYTFVPDSTKKNRVDVIDLTSGLTSVSSLLSSKNHVVRLLLTSDQKGYGTYFGAGATAANKPVLNVTAAVPEPASFLAVGAGLAGVLLRSRRAR